MAEKSELLQGTPDLLILMVAALGPAHGFGIAQLSHGVVQIPQGSL